MRPVALLFGRFGPPFLAFARSVKAQGWDVYFLELSSGQPTWQKHSSCLGGGATIAPDRVGTPAGMDIVATYAQQIGARVLVALTDSHLFWLARERSRLEPTCRVLVPPIATLERMAPKRDQIELAKQVGFDVLSTTYIRSAADVADVPDADFPVCLRPSSETAVTPAFKVQLAHTRAELAAFVGTLTFHEDVIIAQPFQPLPNMVVHGARSEDGRQLANEAFLVTRKFEGIALSMRRVAMPRAVDEQTRAFAENAALTGCFHFDLLYDEALGKAWYLEINVRLGGTTDKVFRRGYDEPALLLASFGQAVSTPSVHTDDLRPIVNKRALLKHLMHALRGRLTELDFPAGSPTRHALASLRELITVQDSVFDWRDLRGSFDFHLRKPTH